MSVRPGDGAMTFSITTICIMDLIVTLGKSITCHYAACRIFLLVCWMSLCSVPLFWMSWPPGDYYSGEQLEHPLFPIINYGCEKFHNIDQQFINFVTWLTIEFSLDLEMISSISLSTSPFSRSSAHLLFSSGLICALITDSCNTISSENGQGGWYQVRNNHKKE